MPADFIGLNRPVNTDAWLSTDAALGATRRQARNDEFEMVARLKPGVTIPHAAAVLDAAIRGEGKHKPAPAGSQGTVLEQHFALGWRAGMLFGGGLLLILGGVLFVACANVAQWRWAPGRGESPASGWWKPVW
jgi:hypothetical protein